jgi:hypothetical protein
LLLPDAAQFYGSLRYPPAFFYVPAEFLDIPPFYICQNHFKKAFRKRNKPLIVKYQEAKLLEITGNEIMKNKSSIN